MAFWADAAYCCLCIMVCHRHGCGPEMIAATSPTPLFVSPSGCELSSSDYTSASYNCTGVSRSVKKGNLVEHEYWGNRVVKDLERVQGFKSGIICVDDTQSASYSSRCGSPCVLAC